MNLGINTDFDSSRLIKLSAVIDNQLCYHSKSIGCVRGFFELRHDLFSTYYMHKTSQAIDIMFSDALISANSHFNFLDVIHDPVRYAKFNDKTLLLISKSKK